VKSNSIASGWASVKICFRILFYVHCNDGVETEKDSERIVENTHTNWVEMTLISIVVWTGNLNFQRHVLGHGHDETIIMAYTNVFY
jgi:hypothetical protein